MIVERASRDWREKKIREWQLLLLRFAITREAADSSAVQALAEELDSVGLWWQPTAPSFFRRTSQEVCAAIQAAGAPQQTAVLQEYITRIADPRLRRAFASAISLQQPGPQRPSLKRARRKEADLWKGLARK